ncbi:MAG TPA: glycosyl transferase family 36 [Rudaea sp.]|nr:glycosyl transferase family 36 [Rudaea sp.]
MSEISSATFDGARHCLMSNGRYSVLLAATGSGFSRWRDLAVTRWREDPVCDGWGSYLMVRDEVHGQCWAATAQPYGATNPDDRIAFHDGVAHFERQDHGLRCTLEVAVAADADRELRRLTLRNDSNHKRKLSITSYAELVLGPAGADNAHPAFSKMFVQTQWDEGNRILLATRRKRANDEPSIWAAHAMQVVGEPGAPCEYETNRALFLGRGHTLRSARAMQPGVALGNSSGCVLDPVLSMRRYIEVPAQATVVVHCWTQVAHTRDGALAVSKQFDREDAAQELFDGAARQAKARLQDADISAQQARQFAHWLDAIMLSDRTRRAAADAIRRGRGGPPTLWGASISGDRPIVLQRVANEDDNAGVEEIFRAQRVWQQQRVGVDVVVLDAQASDTVQEKFAGLVDAQKQRLESDDKLVRASVFLLRDAQISAPLRDGLLCVARLLLGGNAQEINQQSAPSTSTTPSAALRATTPIGNFAELDAADEQGEFANGFGAFVDAGRAYRMVLTQDRCTPQPWVNVIANPTFGFLVSAEGGGYAWSINSQQNPLTPWPNDPVSDIPHEIVYLRDREEGILWSATALPIRVADATYTATHGKGWSRFSNDAHGITIELTQCVPVADTLKISRLRINNRSARTRRLSLTAYVEWALGANGSTPAPFVITARDERTGAIFARNHWRPDFADRVAFFDLGGVQQSSGADRKAFLGELGSVADPAALREAAPLDGRFGAGLDPCGALQTDIDLPPDTQIELRLLLGDAPSESDAQALINKYRTIEFDVVMKQIAEVWDGLLDPVQVQTPNRAMDLMLNDWLLYQVVSCRLWARTAYYQASGAYGFRDQLQDVMALCLSRPDLAREHLLRAAGRQFSQGDVQHWWQPPTGQGIRTRISDDRVWLGFVAMHYVQVSGDAAVLDVAVAFLDGPPVPDGGTDAYFQPTTSNEKVSVYEHCARGLDSSLATGAHDLPLIGTGDWNDGMNAVGAGGKGESAWLGWLLICTIAALAPQAEQRGESQRAQNWKHHADQLRAALEQAWDGEWYRRGYYDDGTPVGSRLSDECKIDSIAQSWSVIADGADNRQHAGKAMESVDQLLVDRQHRLARLFTPAFDRCKENPGYIKGYPPGVRENAGQYTHGAIWSIFAWTKLGDGKRACELFDMFNSIRHSDSAAGAAQFKVEPFVSCADVYSIGELAGHGGWTWYTGSAAWLYRAGVEAILGFHKHADCLRIDPCIPADWPGYRIRYQHRGKQHVSTYEIGVENPHQVCRGVALLELDGKVLAQTDAVVLADDGAIHELRVVLGASG